MSLRTCRFETNLHCGQPQKEVEKLQAELETAETHIGWLKEGRDRLNNSIKVRDNAFDALLDLKQRNEKKLQAKLATANEEIERLGRELQVARCPCGGWLEGLGYEQAARLVIYECDKCEARLELPMVKP